MSGGNSGVGISSVLNSLHCFGRRVWQKTSSLCSCLRGPGKRSAKDEGDPAATSGNDESSNNGDGEAPFVEVDILRRDLSAKRNYPDNSIRTAKYTLVSCFPRSLFAQFYRVSNVYFLVVVVISVTPGLSPVNPLSSVMPFCIVLGAGIAKDLWEDAKRRESDRRANSIRTRVLCGSEFDMVASRDVRVGDVMLYKLGEEVRADVLLLNSSHAGGVAYIETANLDGETNAKTRRAKPLTIEALGTVEDIIDRCLPSTEMKAHFLQHGSMEKWNDSKSGVTSSSDKMLNSTGKIFGEDTTCKSGECVELNSMKLQSREPPLVMSAESSLETYGNNALTGVGHCTHPHSRVVSPLEPGHCDPHRHHEGGLTFDERFVVGHEVPVPSDILTLSRKYDERHMDHSTRTTDVKESGGEARKAVSAEVNQRNGEASTKATTHSASRNVKGTLSTGGFSPSDSSIAGNEELGKRSNGVVVLGAAPCAELYSWIGQLRLGNGELVPLGIEQFLPRGCVIRNTEWVLGVVLYTGESTKMLLNMRQGRVKKSFVARRLNYINLFLLLLQQVVLLIICSLAVLWQNSRLEAPEGTRSGFSSWYIQWFLSRHSPRVLFGIRYLTNFVLISYLIPLSLYVTLEFNKSIQMALIACDRRMAIFDEFTGELRYSRPKTSELNSQLAHVRYIFTDKTGTLTQNCMTYVGGSVGTERHDEQKKPGALGEAFLNLVKHQRASGLTTRAPGVLPASSGEDCRPRPHSLNSRFGFEEEKMESEPVFQYLRALSLCHTVVCFEDKSVNEAATLSHSVSSVPLPMSASEANAHTAQVNHTRETSELPVHDLRGSLTSAPDSGVFHGSTATGAGVFLRGSTGSASWHVARHSDMHERSLSVVAPQVVLDMRDKSKIYEGQSLDEIALVTAARNNLFALAKRSATHMYVRVAKTMMCYEIIAELEFTPQRKLMSILLCRCPSLDGAVDADGAESPEIGYHRKEAPTPGEEEEKGNEERRKAPRQQPLPSRERDIYPLEISGESPSDTESTHSDRTRGREREREVKADQYLLLVKGADNSMMEIVKKSNPRNIELRDVFLRELGDMAREGLRTLVLGQRYLTESEVLEWLPLFNEAQCSMQNRGEKLHRVYALMEKDIDLIGTTAVEDELQEGVPETLEFFLQAEIVIWMLTGDKRETAVTIADTSGIVDSRYEDSVFHLDVAAASVDFDTVEGAALVPSVRRVLEAQMTAAAVACDSADSRYEGRRVVVLVVDGLTLDVVFSDDSLTKNFFQLGMRCRSAVCCRMTPLQKAKVVRLFRKNTHHTTLAIGDGANDVSMIQESHIGIGIMGLEGSQAELSSDYAIPAFRFLKRLLVVHGRFAFYRDAHCILFSIYKNVILCVGLNVFAFYCGFSGMVLIESWLLMLFNLFFCAVQPIGVGVFDKDVTDELAESVPSLYPPLAREGMFFNPRYMLKWLIDGLVNGFALIFLLIYAIGETDTLYPHRSPSLQDYGMTFYVMMLLIVNLRVAAMTTCYTLVLFAFIAYGFIAIPFITLAYSALSNLFGLGRSAYITMELMGTAKFWLMLLFTAGVFVVYGVAGNAYIAMFWPWTNGGPAMQAAWTSPFRSEHHERLRRMRRRASSRTAAPPPP